jgi:hypothetical protein
MRRIADMGDGVDWIGDDRLLLVLQDLDRQRGDEELSRRMVTDPDRDWFGCGWSCRFRHGVKQRRAFLAAPDGTTRRGHAWLWCSFGVVLVVGSVFVLVGD